MQELVDLKEFRLVPSARDSPVDSSRFHSELLDFDDLTVVASWGCPTPSFTGSQPRTRTSSARTTLARHRPTTSVPRIGNSIFFITLSSDVGFSPALVQGCWSITPAQSFSARAADYRRQRLSYSRPVVVHSSVLDLSSSSVLSQSRGFNPRPTRRLGATRVLESSSLDSRCHWQLARQHTR